MSHSKSYEFLLKDISTLKRVGQKTKNLLKKKKIETLFDVLWNLPQAFVDRSNLINISNLQVGTICTIKVQVIKYNIPVITTDRGGQITYHAPGQLLVYILFDLKRRSIKIREFIHDFETIMLNAVRYYSKEATLNKSDPGIFIKDKKIVSFGLKIAKGRSYHGASINISMNMEPWKRINVCGKKNQQVTDLEKEGIPANVSDVSKVISQLVLTTF